MDTFNHTLGNLQVYTNPKCSCRSIEKFANEVVKQMGERLASKKTNILIFRNPYNRLISGYLNKYVEHTKYLARGAAHKINTFEKFVKEMKQHNYKHIDRLHFLSQFKARGLRSKNVNLIFDSENLIPFQDFVNKQLQTNAVVPPHVLKLFPRTIGKVGFIKNSTDNYKLDLPPYTLKTQQLRDLLKENQLPLYSQFYNDELAELASQIYIRDLTQINHCFCEGKITEEQYKKFISI